MSRSLKTFGGMAVKGKVNSEAATFVNGTVRPIAPVTRATAGAYSLDAFDSTLYRSSEYVVQITQGSNFAITHLTVLHDGTNAYVSEYGRVEKPNATNVVFDAGLVGGLVNLVYTQPGVSTTITSVCTSINV